jgi:AcrR family transcriptional regulator
MSPRTKEQNEQIREQRKQQIAEAAAVVYLNKGMQMEVRDVALQAGFGYGTVYHYYKNKLELLDELLWSALNNAKKVRDEALLSLPRTDHGSGLLRLRRYSQALLREWLVSPSLFILYKLAADNFHGIGDNRYDALADQFQSELYRPVVLELQGAFGEKAAEKWANMLIGAWVGCAGVHILHGHQETELCDMADAIMDGMVGKAGG